MATPVERLLRQRAAGATSKGALDACLADLERAATGQHEPGCLAIVLACSEHTYARPGTLLHVAADGERHGWISAGCLEADVLAAAAATRAEQRARLLDLDNRDLSDVFSGSGAGCRGRQLLLLLPLAALPGLLPLLERYRDGDRPLKFRYASDGALTLRLPPRLRDSGGSGEQADLCAHWQLACEPATEPTPAAWALQLQPLPRVLIAGGGPESELLLPLLDALGWRVDLVESRPQWAGLGALAERHLTALPAADGGAGYVAVLIMAHHFGNDRDALAMLAGWPRLPPYLGLLGARTRSKDLFATLPASVRERLAGCLESPAGLPLCGRGGAAIALSLAARLQGLQVEDRDRRNGY
jgi:xanthine dehydrogenase accessory factor